MTKRQRPHTPVKYLDRLLRLTEKVHGEAYRYEDVDPEVFHKIKSAVAILYDAVGDINHNDDERGEFRRIL